MWPLTATPRDGYDFDGWYMNGEAAIHRLHLFLYR